MKIIQGSEEVVVVMALNTNTTIKCNRRFLVREIDSHIWRLVKHQHTHTKRLCVSMD